MQGYIEFSERLQGFSPDGLTTQEVALGWPGTPIRDRMSVLIA